MCERGQVRGQVRVCVSVRGCERVSRRQRLLSLAQPQHFCIVQERAGQRGGERVYERVCERV